MKVLNRKLLTDFMITHADAKTNIEPLVAELENARWKTPNELKRRFPKASVINGQDVVFDIVRNKYRLHVIVNYAQQIVMAKRVGTHKEYDRWRF